MVPMGSIAKPSQQQICLLSVSLGLLTFATPSFALTTELITNGGFETGDFTGWTTGEQAGSNGSISVVSGTSGPNSGQGSLEVMQSSVPELVLASPAPPVNP
jgi:hypothetical protein